MGKARISEEIRAFLLCARHGVKLGGESPLRTAMVGTVSRRQGRHREVGSEGSPRQNLDPTNRNRIQGRRGGVIRQRTETPDNHSDTRGGKSGGDQGKALRLTLGGLFVCGTNPLPTPQGTGTGAEESAEAIVARPLCGRRAESLSARSSLAKLDGRGVAESRDLLIGGRVPRRIR